MGSTQKSDSEVTQLVHEVLRAPDFDMQDLSRFDASRETSQFNAAKKKIPPEDAFRINKWKCASIDISVPTREKKKEGNYQVLAVEQVYYI